ncbi:hypothetical protein FNV43_RR17166 [Rhamnella rubrinervis]|uniref:Uncharacterized protein n=1 Tax=Rhamnella rubrinervis TaxID=2594499 RepID=A0A8K0DYA1_9ROSA|nr:hypothetical protein FNV43_RR17166 [Rhamnella rubrinervis]
MVVITELEDQLVDLHIKKEPLLKVKQWWLWDQGHLLYLASKLMKCGSPFEAEEEALSWKDVEWETDAKDVEKAISAKDDPLCWYAYHSICSIRECFVNRGQARKRKQPYAMPQRKSGLLLGRDLVFYEFSLGSIPPCILDVLLAEQAAAL